MGRIDLRLGNHGSVLKHIFQINQLAVVERPRNVTHVVDMNYALIVGAHDVLREQIPPADIFADLGCEVIPHRAVDNRILIRVFLDGKFIVMPEKTEDFSVRCVLTPFQLVPQAVFAVSPGKAVLFSKKSMASITIS